MKTNKLKLSHLLLLLLITLTVACSQDAEEESTGSIEGTWNAVSCTNDGGTSNYGVANYANVAIRFTLKLDGTYTWITDNSKSTSSVPVVINGTYIYTSSTNKLKVTGKALVGSYSFNDNHLYTVEKLTNSKLIIAEETGISSIGKQTYVLSR
jgi:hypothetical protein